MNCILFILLLTSICYVMGFTNYHFHHNTIAASSKRMNLSMGRAAAVRANTKARTDGAKAKNNNRFAKKIIMATKAGGPDTNSNRQLAQVIADAKANDVPMDVIKRNIEKASATNQADYNESLFEFIGPGGIYYIINVLTDNDNRAASDVNLVGKKHNLKSSSKGSVAFNFLKKARLDIGKIIEEDELMELCLESGVDDYDLRTVCDGNPVNPKDEKKCTVYVEMKDMAALRDLMRSKGYQLETSVTNIPKDGCIAPSDEDYDLNLAAIAAFEALDDVDSVETNLDLTETD